MVNLMHLPANLNLVVNPLINSFSKNPRNQDHSPASESELEIAINACIVWYGKRQMDLMYDRRFSEARWQACHLEIWLFEKPVTELSNFSQLFSRCIMSTVGLPPRRVGDVQGPGLACRFWIFNEKFVLFTRRDTV